MNFKHIIFMITLVPCMSHAMDKKNDEPKKKNKSALQLNAPKSKEKSSSVTKQSFNTTPEAIHIAHLFTPVACCGTTKLLGEWLRKDNIKKFGKTDVINLSSGTTRDKAFVTFLNKVTNITPDQRHKLMVGEAIYCSNINKKGYGAIGLWNGNATLFQHRIENSKNEFDTLIHRNASFILSYYFTKTPSKQLPIENKSNDATTDKLKEMDY
jgi:hypothetical protein